MTNATPFDRQLADLVWMMATALRAGYTVQQALEQLASQAPEPAAGACARVAADLNGGLSLEQALANWQQSVPSAHLGDVAAAILEHQGTAGLPAALEPIGEAILAKAGTDAAFFPAMQGLAQAVGASLPQRARGNGR